MELSIVLPCLNEQNTIAQTICDAQRGCLKGKYKYEIIVADNGSTDYSVAIARLYKARIIHVKKRGYGVALRAGIKAAKYNNVIMADADTTYELENLGKFVKYLDKYDLVIGDRFCDPNIQMSFSHYIGNKILSFLARKLYNSPVRDFHCGIRAFKKDKIMSLNLHTSGMEFASEMICIAEKKGLKIKEVPTILKKNIRPAKLNTIKDGLRHLRFLVSYC